MDDSKREETMVKKILDRADYEFPELSVYAILKSFGMESYHSVACDRIASAGLVDMEHVMIDITQPGNLMLDEIGFSKCEDILVGYIGKEVFDTTLEYMESMSEYIAALNAKLQLWRKGSIASLLYAIGMGCRRHDSLLWKEALAEICSRTWLNKIRVKLVDIGITLHVKFRYRREFKFLNSVSKGGNPVAEVKEIAP